jgi:hypothetical protein
VGRQRERRHTERAPPMNLSLSGLSADCSAERLVPSLGFVRASGGCQALRASAVVSWGADVGGRARRGALAEGHGASGPRALVGSMGGSVTPSRDSRAVAATLWSRLDESGGKRGTTWRPDVTSHVPGLYPPSL